MKLRCFCPVCGIEQDIVKENIKIFRYPVSLVDDYEPYLEEELLSPLEFKNEDYYVCARCGYIFARDESTLLEIAKYGRLQTCNG